jgi:hypothetical protein
MTLDAKNTKQEKTKNISQQITKSWVKNREKDNVQ